MATASPHSTLHDELKLLGCLIDLMKQEQQFLVAANAEGLQTLTPLKNQLIEQMAALSAQRHHSLGADGFIASDVGMEAWLVRMANPTAAGAWEQVLDKAREAKELNRVNGMLINKQMTNNLTLLNAMRAPAGATDTAFYGPSGQTTSVSGKRPLVVG